MERRKVRSRTSFLDLNRRNKNYSADPTSQSIPDPSMIKYLSKTLCLFLLSDALCQQHDQYIGYESVLARSLANQIASQVDSNLTRLPKAENALLEFCFNDKWVAINSNGNSEITLLNIDKMMFYYYSMNAKEMEVDSEDIRGYSDLFETKAYQVKNHFNIKKIILGYECYLIEVIETVENKFVQGISINKYELYVTPEIKFLPMFYAGLIRTL